MSDNIKVVVKVRPLIPREIDQKLSFQWRVKNNTLYQLDESAKEFGPSFTFDKIYDETTKTVEVYNDVAKPIVESAIGGINGTIFAYGQTSSGKTYTMAGTEESPGIIPLSVKHLFEVIKTITDRDFLVRVSYIEIYNETVKDLLDIDKKNIKIFDTIHGVRFDATEKPTSSPEEVLAVMKEGEVNRQTGATNMNEESSRSHSIFQITIESRKHLEGEEEAESVNVSQLNLVDLAGSERAGQTGATGIRFKEGTHINKSLSVLALVIKQLSEDPNKHANYRDSKLTRILQNSIGGNAKTSIICAITPASVEETISTLQFANRAKSIKNKPEVNAVATNATKIHDLLKQLSKLKTQLESKKNLEQDNVNLQKQIAGLQKFILNGLSRPSVEVVTTGRKKWQQPSRRVTISTLRPIEEDTTVTNFCAPVLPSYCTPSLKYNPLTVATPDFLPIQNSSTLLSVPEDLTENPRLVTPPPKNPEVVDVINLDSDEESTQEPCSPYHKCYDKRKTPPCILRKTAQQAEKNLKDIVELTEREKIYSPSVNELLEKLEQNANVISELQEKLNLLSNESQEKDALLQSLQKTVQKTENQIKAVSSAKTELEMKCSDYNTKLTDLEVMYETLLKKSKTREEELLSLLGEQQGKKCKKTGSTTYKPLDQDSQFLEMSALSLVSSDNESSSADSVEDIQKQQALKNLSISQYECKIYDQKQKMYSLESSKQELERTIQTLENKLTKIINENDFLKSTVNNLNSNIEAQKETIRKAHDDIKSYNSLIQELQIKLNEKSSVDPGINEINLENMIANEDKLTANNENMQNIIKAIKTVMENRKQEINANLKTDKEISYLKEQITTKENEIKTLVESVESLKVQLQQKETVLNDLILFKEELTKKLCVTEENNNVLRKECHENCIALNETKVLLNELTSAKEDITKKLQETQENNSLLQKQNEENECEIQNLLAKNVTLVRDLSLKENFEITLSEKIRNLEVENEELVKRIQDFELQSNSKTDQLKSVSDFQSELENKLFKPTIGKLIRILQIPTCFESVSVPQSVTDIDSFVSALEDFLNNFETTVLKLIELKNQSELKLLQVEQNFSVLQEKYHVEKMSLQTEIKSLSKERDEKSCETEMLLKSIEVLKNQFSETCQELDAKGTEIIELETKLNDIKENNENLRNELLSKDDVIVSLHERITDLLSETKTLSHEIEQKNSELASFDARVNELLTQNERLKEETIEKSSSIASLNKKINDLLAQSQLITEENTEKTSMIACLEERINKLFAENLNLKQIMEKTALELNTTTHPQTNVTDESQSSDDPLIEHNMKLDFLRILVENKNAEVSRLRKNIYCLRNTQTKEDTLNDLIRTKNHEISELTDKLKFVELQLQDKCNQVLSLTQELTAANNNRDNMLNFILEETTNILLRSKIIEEKAMEKINQDNTSLFDQIIRSLHEISETFQVACGNETDGIKTLSQAKDIITELTQRNSRLADECKNIAIKNEELVQEMDTIKQINRNLHGTSNLLEQLKLELKTKAEEIQLMEMRTQKIKAEFVEFERIVTEQIDSLREENERLKETISFSEKNDLNQNKNKLFKDASSIPSKESETSENNSKQISPHSLLTICCNKIIEDIQTQEAKPTSPSFTKTNSEFRQIELACECIELNMQLKAIKDEKQNLLVDIKHLESIVLQLTQERNELRREVQVLLELIEELHKKIVNHRTNLSTLTATTYAENKLLNSQLKVLKHHHTRYINLCQRDIPSFKIQLQELMSILKSSSFLDKQNNINKRLSLPDVLTNDSTMSTIKNESVLDGDSLMLDSNVTFSTSLDTLVGNDQSCLDMTQINCGETTSQNSDETKVFDSCSLQSQIEILMTENQNLCKIIEELKQENAKLQSDIELNLCSKNISSNECKFDKDPSLKDKLKKELETLAEELYNAKQEKSDIEKKYSELTLEIPKSEALVKKINLLEDDLRRKTKEVTKLTQDVSEKNKTIKDLEKENGELSNQLMENISEVDDLKTQLELNLKQINKLDDLKHELAELRLKKTEDENLQVQLDLLKQEQNMYKQILLEHQKELDQLRKQKAELSEKLKETETVSNYSKGDAPLENTPILENYNKLNRSLSDSESSLRFHKIVTLQHELNQSKEECLKITEEVATFKKDYSDMGQPMDLDESMGDAPANLESENVPPKLFSNIPENYQLEDYKVDKINCINFLVEKTDADKTAFGFNVKMTEVMQTLYTHLISKHNNEIENLYNRLKDFGETKKNLETQLKDVTVEYSNLLKELNSKQIIRTDVNILNSVKDNLKLINSEIINSNDTDKSKAFTVYRESILKVLDVQLGLDTAKTLDCLLTFVQSQHTKDMQCVENANKVMKERLDSLLQELETTKINLDKIKNEMVIQEKEYNNLKEQNKTILDALQNSLKNTISSIFIKLRHYNIVKEDELDPLLPVDQNINLLFDRLINELQKRSTAQKDDQLKIVMSELQEKENELKVQKSSHEDLSKIYSQTLEEHKKVSNMIDKLQGEILEKQTSIENLKQLVNKKTEEDLSEKIQPLITEIESLKSMNSMIMKEKESYTLELEKSNAIIKQNKEEINKMTADILQLRDSMKENLILIDAMKTEARSIMDENKNLKEKLDLKHQDCCRLEINIKTLEKSAEIQSNLIKRLQKQKEEDEKVKIDKDTKIEELTQKCRTLEEECETVKTEIQICRKQLDDLTLSKVSLEAKVAELEKECEQKCRLSLEFISNNAQRRRKSLLDSKRMFSEENIDFEAQQNKIQEMFESRDAPHDLFMEVDEYGDDSNRSTPLRLSKGRESLTTKQDQSDKEEDGSSRPNSVQAIRKRRQSTYDLRRSVVGRSPSPDEHQDSNVGGTNRKNSSGSDKRSSLNNADDDEHSRPSSVLATRRKRQSMYDQHRSVRSRSSSPNNDVQVLKAVQGNMNIKCDQNNSPINLSSDREVITLRERVSQLELELDDLKERYRELDEECETCAQYLQERDKQCALLRKEKIALQKVIEELQEVKSLESKPSLINVSVNTDEDWAHLHSVVVDRMSFDAEVEKNKRLMKTVEELRYGKQELNNVIAKMQKALDRQAAGRDHREYEALKSELKCCKEELQELKERYRELDEECETCAQMLREKEDQCRKLKEAKTALEKKLEEYQEEEGLAALSRRRRHNAHDARRLAHHYVDATTDTDDIISYDVEHNGNLSQILHESLLQEISALKLAYENLCKEKMTLEHMLATRQVPAVHPTMFVATGSAIVQGQQITDLMKENHKLKKINSKLVHLCKKRGKSHESSEDKEEQTG